MNFYLKCGFDLICGLAITILVSGATFLAICSPADATTKYAQETGKPCAQCHQHPTGGTALTPFGEKFRANKYVLPKEPAK